jgi:uncharacterized membrane protein
MSDKQHDAADTDTTSTQDAARIALGLMLVTAGISHLTFAREAFKAQVPPWIPIDPDTVVLQSGAVEISLGAALIFFRTRRLSLVSSQAPFLPASCLATSPNICIGATPSA